MKPLSKRQRVENVRIKIATCRYHCGVMLNTYARSRYLNAAKYAVLIPGPGVFVNVRNAARVIIPPHPKYPCFAVCALVCDFSSRAGCVLPAFARESKRGAFVGEVEKRNEERLGDKIYGCSFAEFSPSADSGGSQGTGKCMYIKAWRNQGSQMLTT